MSLRSYSGLLSPQLNGYRPGSALSSEYEGSSRFRTVACAGPLPESKRFSLQRCRPDSRKAHIHMSERDKPTMGALSAMRGSGNTSHENVAATAQRSRWTLSYLHPMESTQRHTSLASPAMAFQPVRYLRLPGVDRRSDRDDDGVSNAMSFQESAQPMERYRVASQAFQSSDLANSKATRKASQPPTVVVTTLKAHAPLNTLVKSKSSAGGSLSASATLKLRNATDRGNDGDVQVPAFCTASRAIGNNRSLSQRPLRGAVAAAVASPLPLTTAAVADDDTELSKSDVSVVLSSMTSGYCTSRKSQPMQEQRQSSGGWRCSNPMPADAGFVDSIEKRYALDGLVLGRTQYMSFGGCTSPSEPGHSSNGLSPEWDRLPLRAPDDGASPWAERQGQRNNGGLPVNAKFLVIKRRPLANSRIRGSALQQQKRSGGSLVVESQAPAPRASLAIDTASKGRVGEAHGFTPQCDVVHRSPWPGYTGATSVSVLSEQTKRGTMRKACHEPYQVQVPRLDFGKITAKREQQGRMGLTSYTVAHNNISSSRNFISTSSADSSGALDVTVSSITDTASPTMRSKSRDQRVIPSVPDGIGVEGEAHDKGSERPKYVPSSLYQLTNPPNGHCAETADDSTHESYGGTTAKNTTCDRSADDVRMSGTRGCGSPDFRSISSATARESFNGNSRGLQSASSAADSQNGLRDSGALPALRPPLERSERCMPEGPPPTTSEGKEGGTKCCVIM
ncbi:hypothetical protein, conserved [Leishmania lindenbergi]|uniref:Uncharacterized protein n=1 Tax=Leishmania lindenbergi TaxID=651832 RepID=A0AAW3AXD7_9TRYP